MNMAEAGEAGGVIGAMPGKTTRMASMAASEQWKCNKNVEDRGVRP